MALRVDSFCVLPPARKNNNRCNGSVSAIGAPINLKATRLRLSSAEYHASEHDTVKMKAYMVKATKGLVHPCEPSIQNEIFHYCPQIEPTSRCLIPSITGAHELIVKTWLQGSADPAKQNAPRIATAARKGECGVLLE